MDNKFPAFLKSKYWLWLIDQEIPKQVKRKYPQHPHLAEKPFDQRDIGYYTRSIKELSRLLTSDREDNGRGRGRHSQPTKTFDYFAHAKFRSSYLLYFLPLQLAKFLTLMGSHSRALAAGINKETEFLKVLDCGAGPGTASLALLIELKRKSIRPDRLEFHWCDLNKKIMLDGKDLLQALVSKLWPKDPPEVSVFLHEKNWNRLPPRATSELDLAFFGHLLNEGRGPRTLAPLLKIVDANQSCGTLLLEPATRSAAQILASVKNELEGQQLWGPCLHQSTCPLSHSHNWCHQSYPVSINGKIYQNISKRLSSERRWLKWTYLWIPSREFEAPSAPPQLRRVVSDVIPGSKGRKPFVLLCEPEQAVRMTVNPRKKLSRGQIISHNPDLKNTKRLSREP